MSLDEPNDDDQIEEVCGIKFVMGKKLAEKLGAIKIDYKITLTKRDFTITPKTPN
ncbi:MAG: hypothetical protein AAGU27_24775 [Dehalobacterium sp.]